MQMESKSPEMVFGIPPGISDFPSNRGRKVAGLETIWSKGAPTREVFQAILVLLSWRAEFRRDFCESRIG
jgi:hypothetical protein